MIRTSLVAWMALTVVLGYTPGAAASDPGPAARVTAQADPPSTSATRAKDPEPPPAREPAAGGADAPQEAQAAGAPASAEEAPPEDVTLNPGQPEFTVVNLPTTLRCRSTGSPSG